MIITIELNWRAAALPATALTALLCVPFNAETADDVSYLPPLGNTEQVDHALSREVTDEHVYDGDTGILPAKRVQTNATDNAIWESIQQSQGLGLQQSELVEQFKQNYLDQAHFTNQMLERSQLYIAHLVKALDQRYLPVELALLPAIESGFLPRVVSRESAVGLWQIVPITAQEIGIEQNRWFDGRADIQASTTAAIDYLSYLNAEFDGDWELALAAYNAGPGRVRGAMKRNIDAGKGTSFAELELPDETRNYVPKFAALLQLVKDPEQNKLRLPAVSTEDAFEVVDLETRVSLSKLAELSQLTEATLKNLNSGLLFGVTPPDGPHTVYLPRGQRLSIQQAVASIPPEQLFQVPSTHTVAAGETLGGIAIRYGMSMQVLQTTNRLASDRIRIGQELTVFDSEFVKQPKLVQYQVASGDTLSAIAEQFSVTVAEIVSAAGEPLASDVIRPGDTLQILVASPNGS